MRLTSRPILRTSPPDCKAQSFDFLGFTHSWGKSRKGKNVVRQTTAKSRFAGSLAAVKEWCRTNRHRPAREQHAWLSAVINGHYAYYGITGNHRRLQEYRHQVVKIWRKWLERRTRGWLLIWANFRPPDIADFCDWNQWSFCAPRWEPIPVRFFRFWGKRGKTRGDQSGRALARMISGRYGMAVAPGTTSRSPR